MDKIIFKIKKLFDLAENNNSEEEAQAALEMARKLLQEHGLSMLDINLPEEKQSLAGEVDVCLEGKKRLAIWMLTLADVVARYFDVGCLHRNSIDSHKLWFFGNKVNSQAAAIAVPSLVSQIETLAKAYRNPTVDYYFGKSRKHTLKARESYILGLIRGFAERLMSMKAKEAEDTQTTALAVFNDDLQQEWLNSQKIKIRTIKRPAKTVQNDAYQHGQRDSAKLSINPILGGNK